MRWVFYGLPKRPRLHWAQGPLFLFCLHGKYKYTSSTVSRREKRMKKLLLSLFSCLTIYAVAMPVRAQGQEIAPVVKTGMAAAELANTANALHAVSVASQNLYRVISNQSWHCDFARQVVSLRAGTSIPTLPEGLRPSLTLPMEKARGVVAGTERLFTAQEKEEFYLYVLPQLMVEEPSLSYANILPEAAAYYRDMLSGWKERVPELNWWARGMSAITGLSMTGTIGDIPLIVNSVKRFPSQYQYRTDLHAAIHLMSFGEPGYKAVQDLLDLRLAQGNELPHSWVTISSRMGETGHHLYVPQNRVDPLGPSYEPPEIDNALARFNPLNYALNIALRPDQELVSAYVDMLKTTRRAAPLGFNGAVARQTAVSPMNRIGTGAAPKISPFAFPRVSLELTAPGVTSSLPGAGQAGVRTAQETQHMETLLQYLQKNIQENQRLLQESEEELATLERRQKWLPFGRENRAGNIEYTQSIVEIFNKEVTELQDRLARATAAIEEGQALSQVMSIAYNEPVIETQFYATVSSGQLPGTTELVAAPGARTAQEAQEMSTLLNSLENYVTFYDRVYYQDIEEAVTSLRKTASMAGVGSRAELRGHFAEMHSASLERRRDFRERFDRTKTAIKEGQSLAQVKNLAYGGKGGQVGANQFYVMRTYSYRGIPILDYYPAPGARTQWEAWKMQEYLLKVETEEIPWGSVHHHERPTVGGILHAIENGASLGRVASIAHVGGAVPKEGPFLLVMPTGDPILEKWSSVTVPAPGATTITEAQQMQALLLHARAIYNKVDFWFTRADGSAAAFDGYEELVEGIKGGKSLPEVWDIFLTHFVPLEAKW